MGGINVYIIGSKGIPAEYGGFETFVDNLVTRRRNKQITYHVACLSDNTRSDAVYRGARCFYVRLPRLGGLRAIIHDIVSIIRCLHHVRREAPHGNVLGRVKSCMTS